MPFDRAPLRTRTNGRGAKRRGGVSRVSLVLTGDDTGLLPRETGESEETRNERNRTTGGFILGEEADPPPTPPVAPRGDTTLLAW